MAITQLSPWNGAHNATATTANTGFASIVKTDTAGTLTFKNTWMPRAVNSLEMVGTTTAGYVLGVIEPGGATDWVALDIPVKPISLPTAEHYMLTFHQVSDARQFGITVYPDGALRVRDGANAGKWSSAATTSPAGVMAVGVPVVIRIFGARDATSGQYHVQVLNEDGTVRADSTLRTLQNTGTAQITHIKVAAKGSSASTLAAGFAFGVPRYDFAASGLIPPWEPPATHHPAHFAVNGVAVPVNMYLAIGGVPVQIA